MKIKFVAMALTLPALLACICLPGCQGQSPDDASRSDSALESQPASESQESRESEAATEAPRQEQEETDVINAYRFFPKPDEGWVGDVMPFYEDGIYSLYYLQDWRDGAPRFHPIHLFRTTDLADYRWMEEAVPCGGLTEQDIAIGTGSFLKSKDGLYHCFYTGHNYNYPKEGKPKEAMMHATSEDGLHWTKIPEDTFTAPEGYETDDFRDPHVFYCEEAGEYWMLVSARKDSYGVIARFTSQDLSSWTVAEPLYAPENYFMLECADLFRLGDYWYLFFAEFDREHATHYRVATSPYGPFETPEYDMLDGRTFYAGKTGGTDENRVLFGWIPTKSPAKDSGKWEWAGNLAALQLTQQGDGELHASLPEAVREQFTSSAISPAAIHTVGGVQDINGGTVLNGADGLCAAVFGQVQGKILIEATVAVSEGANDLGFITRFEGDVSKGFPLTMNQQKQRLEFTSATLDFSKLDAGSAVVTPVPIPAGERQRVSILIDNDICVLYYGERAALSTRIYEMQGSQWGFYAQNGSLTIQDLTVSVMEAAEQ